MNTVQLEPSKMLGFKILNPAQPEAKRGTDTPTQPIGPKIGTKTGPKIGAKTGAKIGAKIGAKTGPLRG